MQKYYSPDTYLNREPSVADILNVDESDVRVGAVFVQCPDGCVCPSQRHISDDRNSHVRMGLQAK